MNRKDFIKLMSLVSAGSLVSPSCLLSSCRKASLMDGFQYNGKVIIIGAGAAGLYAGYLLKSLGVDFTLLEASSVYGGRLGKLMGFSDYPIDTGAQWMHGRTSIIADLVRTKNIGITLDNTEMSYWFQGQVVTSLPKDPFIFDQENLPDISFLDYAHQQGFGTEYDNIIEAIAGDQGADATMLSALWNQKDEEHWVSGDEDFKFNATFFDVFHQHIAQEILPNIQINTPVVSVDYSSDKIQIKDSLNNLYVSDKVIITVPISILQLGEITFVPSLPSLKTEAFSKFGMGPGMKVFMKFSVKFYDDNLYGGSVCAAYLDDTIGKTTFDHVLMAFVMGHQAASLHALGSDAAITNALLQELDSIYNGQASATFLDSIVFDYTAKPYIKGAYGYSKIGMGDARKVAAEPVGNSLFFAGEAMNINGHHQTVHGAVESGYKAVMDMIKGLT